MYSHHQYMAPDPNIADDQMPLCSTRPSIICWSKGSPSVPMLNSGVSPGAPNSAKRIGLPYCASDSRMVSYRLILSPPYSWFWVISMEGSDQIGAKPECSELVLTMWPNGSFAFSHPPISSCQAATLTR